MTGAVPRDLDPEAFHKVFCPDKEDGLALDLNA